MRAQHTVTCTEQQSPRTSCSGTDWQSLGNSRRAQACAQQPSSATGKRHAKKARQNLSSSPNITEPTGCHCGARVPAPSRKTADAAVSASGSPTLLGRHKCPAVGHRREAKRKKKSRGSKKIFACEPTREDGGWRRRQCVPKSAARKRHGWLLQTRLSSSD